MHLLLMFPKSQDVEIACMKQMLLLLLNGFAILEPYPSNIFIRYLAKCPFEGVCLRPKSHAKSIVTTDERSQRNHATNHQSERIL